MRFGLLGTGYWAEFTQGTALAAHPRAELTGIWGRNAEKAQGVAYRLGTSAYAEVDDLFEQVDAVAIALPPDVQAPLAERAAMAGKHLLLDKPLALSARVADEVVDAVEKSGVASVVFFTSRFMPKIVQALAEAERSGGWMAGHVTLLGSIYQPDSPYKDSTWRHEHGGLWDIGPHALSRLLPIFGPVQEVTALMGARQTAHVLLRHTSGVVTEMTLTLDAPAKVAASTTVLYGESGVVEIPNGAWDAVAAFGTAIDELMAVAGSGSGPSHPCDVRFAAQVVRILEAAQKSIDSGRAAVAVDG
jgi:predicted dehydrogenase